MSSTAADKPSRKKKKRRGPEIRDIHRLYEEAVQCPEEDVRFFDRVYSKKNGRPPRVLKEDFCGTALLAAEWVRTRADNEAIGVDLDKATLDWGLEHNIAPLDGDRKRVQIIHANVLDVREPKVDVVAALNFSYFIFKTRGELRKYFENARASLAPGGVLVVDIFGGWESQMEVTDKTRNKGFTYVWQQQSYDPLSHETRFHIHFRFHDGGGIKKAFTYDWRLWGIPEVRELMVVAGFAHTDVYWEGIAPDTGEGDGDFRRVVEAENCPGWNALIVAST
ncbi:MAG: class I SAM-dependent methyltransferase [Candidatus Krumholzibacteria bacterium]